MVEVPLLEEMKTIGGMISSPPAVLFRQQGISQLQGQLQACVCFLTPVQPGQHITQRATCIGIFQAPAAMPQADGVASWTSKRQSLVAFTPFQKIEYGGIGQLLEGEVSIGNRLSGKQKGSHQHPGCYSKDEFVALRLDKTGLLFSKAAEISTGKFFIFWKFNCRSASQFG